MIDVMTKQLAIDEGTRLKVYDDATGLPIGPGYTLKGHPTIGIGRALDVNGITSNEAQTLFDNDVSGVEKSLNEYEWWNALDPMRQAVITSMAFNLGLHGLLHFPKMIAALTREDWATAEAECLDSGAARQLVSRYERYAAILNTGVMPDATSAAK